MKVCVTLVCDYSALLFQLVMFIMLYNVDLTLKCVHKFVSCTAVN